jgi:hypothetical protein
MKVICSLCEREGKPGYLGEREPLDNPAVTHGLCSPHTEQLLESIPSRSFPDAELLIVVRPNDTELTLDLRQQPRRLRRGKVSPLGYTVVRFKRKWSSPLPG